MYPISEAERDYSSSRFGAPLCRLDQEKIRQRSAQRGETPWIDLARLMGENLRIIFDVGANVGDVCRRLAGRFSAAEIYCFEPVATVFAALEHNTFTLDRVHRYPIGFSDASGFAEVFLQPNPGSNSVSRNIDRGLGKARIELHTLDSFCDSHAIDHIDVLKVDTEGHELAVLRGAGRLLARGGISAIYCEVGFFRQDAGHGYFFDLLEFLRTFGFQPCGFYEQAGLWYLDHPVEPNYPWANVLFVHDSIVKAKYGADYDRWIESMFATGGPGMQDDG